MANTYVYISAWGPKINEHERYGLSVYKFDAKSGKLRWVERQDEDVLFNVTFFDKKRCMLYALEEVSTLPSARGGGGGRVFVFHIDPETGRLTKTGCTETFCSNPCYLTQDLSGNYLLVAHHGGNSAITKIGQDLYGNYYPVVEWDDAAIELFRVEQDGTLGKMLDVDKRTGFGPERRQAHARPHTVVMSPSGRLFAVCDKGNDTVSMYQLDEENGKLIRPKHIYTHEGGTLPRYCVFAPKKPWFYHNNENSTNLHAFVYDEDGALSGNGAYSAADISCTMQEKVIEQQGLVMSQSREYIYDIVRGPNIVTVFKVNQDTGRLKSIQHKKIPGIWPRGCTLSPDGKVLLVCCRDSGKVVSFKVGADGFLSEPCGEYMNSAAAYAIFCEMQ